MLGSAIPRRWAVSIALVGLVSIFAVSYAAVWSNPASAADTTGTTGTGAGNGDPLTPAESLADADKLPTNLVLQVGQQITVPLNLLDMNGAPQDSFPTTTIDWTIVSGSGITLQSPTDQRSIVLNANSVGTTTIRGEALQIQELQEFVVGREMTITVTSAVATSTPVPAPTNPGPVPSSIPNATGVVAPEGSILISTTGVESGNVVESQALRDRPAVFVRVGSVNNFFGINVNSVDPSTLPAMPENFDPGSSAADISFVDAAGSAQTNFRLLKSARICLPTNSSDRANGTQNIHVFRYNSSVSQWVQLNTTYNFITQQACANSSNFSNFATGIQKLAATPLPDGNLPATGGWSPGAGLLVFAGILGFVLLGGGAVTMRRARGVRPE